MQNREHLLDLINELSDVLAMLLELKRKGKFHDAVELIDSKVLEHFATDSQYLSTVSEDLLIDVLKNEKGLGLSELSQLAHLLAEKGDILYTQQDLKNSRDTLKNALTIYYFLNDDQDFFSFQNMNKMLLINEKLRKIQVKID
ncbi:MAG: hypothetical protein ACQESW_05620 [Bacteroidota bacterium]